MEIGFFMKNISIIGSGSWALALTKVFVRREILVKYRKYALVFVLILAAIITPPDVASQIIVAIPILILYQISIYISKIVLNKTN